MRPNIYFVVTRNCNYACEHCYLEAGPKQGDTTISDKDFRKVIKNLPEISFMLWLSGGEVFTIKDKVYDFLDYVQFVNKKRKKQNNSEIDVGLQTNGFWAKSDSRIENILSDLHSFNVEGLDIAAHDKFHQRQGTDFDKLKRLEELARDSLFFRYVYLRGTTRKKYVAPVGRARSMGLRPSRMNMTGLGVCKKALDHFQFSILPTGEIYTCCFLRGKVQGNVIQEPLVKIVKRARRQKRIKCLNKEGIEGLALVDGWGEEDFKALAKSNGNCGACFRMYKEDPISFS